MGTTSILLQSKSDRLPNGLGNDSGELGHSLMDHHFRVGASGTTTKFRNVPIPIRVRQVFTLRDLAI